MDKGKIIESGNHHELMNLRGCYYELWKEQLPEKIDFLQTEKSIVDDIQYECTTLPSVI